MANLLKRLFVEDLTGYQPRIVDLERPITIIGISMDTTLKRIYRDVSGLGRRFKQLKEMHPIPHRKEPRAFAAVSRGYDPTTGAMTYMMGEVVTKGADVPEEMAAFEIPAIMYAVFPVRPKFSAGWGPGDRQREGPRLRCVAAGPG
jgi:predicted transcriptional regulator YdeE